MTHPAKPPRRPGKAPRGGRPSIAPETEASDARHRDATTDAGELVREARAIAGVSQRELASDLAEAHGGNAASWQQRITQIERGHEAPTPERLGAILTALGVAADVRCMAALSTVLRPATTGLVDDYGADTLAVALERYAAAVRLA